MILSFFASLKRRDTNAAVDVSGVSLSFDDTINADTWKAYDDAYGQGYGWKASFSLYTPFLSTYSASINSLYNNGHELANHTVQAAGIDPDTYLNTNTEEDYYNDYVAPVDADIAAIVPGFPGTKSLVWPEGKDIISISEYLVNNTGIQITRDTGSLGKQKFYYDGTEQVMNAWGIDNVSGRSVDDIKALIDVAKATNTVVLLLGHTITDAAGDYNVPASKLNAILEYVVAKDMNFYRLDELTPSLFQ